MSADPKRSRKFKRKYGRGKLKRKHGLTYYVREDVKQDPNLKNPFKMHGDVSKAFAEFQKRHGVKRTARQARRLWNLPGQGGEEYPFI